MLLKKLIQNLEIIKELGDLDLDISNIHSDSRKIKEKGLFVAINGFTKNGIEFIGNAIQNGAKAIIVEPDVDVDKLYRKYNMPIISVKNTRKALAIVACNFYNNPSKELKLIGVTGTKGKTTSTFMIKAILEEKGLKVGVRVSLEPYVPCNHCHMCEEKRFNNCTDLRVCGVHKDGMMAEYFSHPVQLLYKLPDDMTFKHAALIEPFTIGLHGATRARV